MNADYEKIVYLNATKKPEYSKLIERNFFESEEIGILFEIGKKFEAKFGKFPSKDQIKIVARNDKYKDKLTPKIIDLIYSEPIDSYDPDFIEQTCESWIKFKNLNSSIIDAIEFFKLTKVTPDNIESVITKVKSIINDRNNVHFDDNLGSDFFNAETHSSELVPKFTSNWNFVDQRSGGYRSKTLITYIAASNVGKSIFLANDAANYVRGGKNVVVITAEMSETDFIHRIGANLLDVDISKYETLSRDEEFVKDRLKSIGNGFVEPGKLFIKEYPTSQVSVPDIEAYVKELSLTNNVKFDIVIVDYINILTNYRNPKADETYMKIKQICEDLRAMAIKNNFLVISASQIGRSSYDSTDFGLQAISESIALVHTADVVYGIIQNTEMKMNQEYWLKILKIRNGAGRDVKAQLRIDYSKMRLIETDQVLESSM